MEFKEFFNSHPTKYKWFLGDIETACKHRSIATEKAGIVSPDKMPVYRIEINPKGSYTLGIVAGIHGDEIAGPLSVLTFLQNCNPKEFKDTRLVIIPLANPTGFEANKRYNWERRDPNRGFCEKDHCEESEIIKKIFGKEKVDLFLSLHEHPSTDKFYMYYSDLANKPFLEKIVDMAKKYFPIRRYQPINGEKVKDGLVPHDHASVEEDRASRCTMENFMLKRGVHYLTTETPGKSPLDKRIKYMVELMRHLVRSP